MAVAGHQVFDGAKAVVVFWARLEFEILLADEFVYQQACPSVLRYLENVAVASLSFR